VCCLSLNMVSSLSILSRAASLFLLLSSLTTSISAARNEDGVVDHHAAGRSALESISCDATIEINYGDWEAYVSAAGLLSHRPMTVTRCTRVTISGITSSSNIVKAKDKAAYDACDLSGSTLLAAGNAHVATAKFTFDLDGYAEGSTIYLIDERPSACQSGAKGEIFVADHEALWSNQWGSSSTDIATSTAMNLRLGSIIIGGHTRGSFPNKEEDGRDDNTLTINEHAGRKDIILMSVSAIDGNLLWAQQYGSAFDEYITGVCIDEFSETTTTDPSNEHALEDNVIFAVGDSASGGLFHDAAGSFSTTVSWLAKFTSDGALDEAVIIPGSGVQFATGVAQLSNGDIAVIGDSADSDNRIRGQEEGYSGSFVIFVAVYDRLTSDLKYKVEFTTDEGLAFEANDSNVGVGDAITAAVGRDAFSASIVADPNNNFFYIVGTTAGGGAAFGGDKDTFANESDKANGIYRKQGFIMKLHGADGSLVGSERIVCARAEDSGDIFMSDITYDGSNDLVVVGKATCDMELEPSHSIKRDAVPSSDVFTMAHDPLNLNR
jgi:hypothetical protein